MVTVIQRSGNSRSEKETIMIESFSTPHNRIRTFMLLGVCGLLGIAAAAIGIDDNPPGILLAFLAFTAFVLAFVHPWRTSRQFVGLLIASVMGLFVFGALFIMCDVLSSKFEGAGLIHDLLSAGGTLFLIATLVCPSGFLVGAIGAVVMAIRNRRK
jgi:hypothetical protein